MDRARARAARRLAAAILGAVATAIALAAPSPARADGASDLADARRLKAALNWAGALAAVERALAAGDGDPVRVAEAHELAGSLAAGLGRDDVAVAHFRILLSLRPDARLPAGTSPKIVAPFDVARGDADAGVAGPLAVHVEPGPPPALVVDRDPLHLVAGARARWTAADGIPAELVARTDGDGDARLVLAVPAGTRDVEIAAVDADGNALWRSDATAASAVAVTAPPRPRAAALAPWARWYVWAAVAVPAAAVGGVAAWRLGVAQHDWDRLRADDGAHDYSELTAIEDRGRRHALTANLAFAAAGVTGAVAAVLLVRDLRHPRGLEPAPYVTGDGAGIVLGGRF
ncbi:MAG: hypothetical protein H6708_01840 [Kofleriaceae bacterium]|nr:hypothetical protein [Kofleriaceae bacterium]